MNLETSDRWEFLASYMNHANLNPAASKSDIQQLVDEAIRYNFHSVTILPYYVQYCSSLLQGRQDICVCAIIGLPYGRKTTESKILETELALRDGADGIELVLNISAAKDQNWDYIAEEVRKIVEVVNSLESTSVKSTTLRKHDVKVCIQMDLLTEPEIQQAIEACERGSCTCIKAFNLSIFDPPPVIKKVPGIHEFNGRLATERDVAIDQERQRQKAESRKVKMDVDSFARWRKKIKGMKFEVAADFQLLEEAERFLKGSDPVCDTISATESIKLLLAANASPMESVLGGGDNSMKKNFWESTFGEEWYKKVRGHKLLENGHVLPKVRVPVPPSPGYKMGDADEIRVRFAPDQWVGYDTAKWSMKRVSPQRPKGKVVQGPYQLYEDGEPCFEDQVTHDKMNYIWWKKGALSWQPMQVRKFVKTPVYDFVDRFKLTPEEKARKKFAKEKEKQIEKQKKLKRKKKRKAGFRRFRTDSEFRKKVKTRLIGGKGSSRRRVTRPKNLGSAASSSGEVSSAKRETKLDPEEADKMEVDENWLLELEKMRASCNIRYFK